MHTYKNNTPEILDVGKYVTSLEDSFRYRKSFDECVIMYLALHQIEHGPIMPTVTPELRAKVVALIDAGALTLGHGSKDGLFVSIIDKLGHKTLEKSDIP